jgi:D-alanine-D-alanine ligase
MINLGVFFGSNSVEHEISIITAVQAMNQLLSSQKYNVIPIYVSKMGLFYTGNELFDIENFKDLNSLIGKLQNINIVKGNSSIDLIKQPIKKFSNNTICSIDIAFPVFHGTYGEDGTFQGFFEILDIPYVGCNVLSSAITMDKIVSKVMLKESGIPVIDYYWCNSEDWQNKKEIHTKNIEEKFSYPVIVKPSNTGSSIGISVAHNRDELFTGIDLVRKFSERILVEKMVKNLLEINISVVGDNEEASVSLCEKPITSEEILTYDDKYKSGDNRKGMSSAKREIPANIPENTKNKIEEIALKAFKVLDCSGVSRLDFIIDKSTDEIFLNEINTIPGSLAFYLWKDKGMEYGELLETIIKIAVKNHKKRKQLIFSNNTNVLSTASIGGIKK